MNPSPFPPDPARCPLCGGDNRCAMEIEQATGQQQPPCWCVARSIPAALLERLPTEARGTACICARCVSAFQSAQTHTLPEVPPR